MRLLSRYLLRQFLTPLVFAFLAMTSIMLLNQVARRFGDLVGKGLPWSVIGEVFLLCLPFIIAMTLPMAVLVAVLYTFSHLAADSEITAMRASGLSVAQLLRPMLVAGGLLAGVNFWFTDQVLPDSNARLKNLLLNIQRKKPTLELREQVINEIPPSGLFLRASRIDDKNGRLRSVAIYDMATSETRRIIYADSGVMGFADNGTDLQLRLWSGSIHAFRQDDQALFQLTDFATNTILIKDVSNRLEMDDTEGIRGDREMTTCEMLEVVRGARQEQVMAATRRRYLAEEDLRALLQLPSNPPPARPPEPPVTLYCQWFAGLEHWWGTAGGDSVAPEAAAGETAPSPAVGGHLVLPDARPGGLASIMAGPGARRPLGLSSWPQTAAALEDVRSAGLRINSYLVEVHKKWAISMACLVFSLVGIPMALRFPRGGMGLVIGGGLFVFAIYYVGLIAGEGLGNKDAMRPWLAMWAPNLIFSLAGLYGLWRVSRESGSTRGGDLGELWESLTGRLRRWRAA